MHLQSLLSVPDFQFHSRSNYAQLTQLFLDLPPAFSNPFPSIYSMYRRIHKSHILAKVSISIIADKNFLPFGFPVSLSNTSLNPETGPADEKSSLSCSSGTSKGILATKTTLDAIGVATGGALICDDAATMCCCCCEARFTAPGNCSCCSSTTISRRCHSRCWPSWAHSSSCSKCVP